MSLKSDLWIRRQCEQPRWVVTEQRHVAEQTHPDGITTLQLRVQTQERLSNEEQSVLEERKQLGRYHNGDPAFGPVLDYRAATAEDLKDWRPMISPFVSGQVRNIERDGNEREQILLSALGETVQKLTKADIGKVLGLPVDRFRIDPLLGLQVLQKAVSYGTSSYGYDVRLDRKFKIFTNVFNGMIDPLCANSERTFIDHEGDSCVIPPHSYILGHTVETFVMPRDVTAICLGKSTYARCFTGDTKVALVDGTTASFAELEERAGRGERFWGYSVDELGNIQVAELTAPRKIGHEAVVEVELDNGEVIRCTPDHQFLTRAGESMQAKDLAEGVSLMPLYRGEYRGYESLYQPKAGRMVSTHWLSDLWNLRHGIYQEMTDTHRHHRDLNRRNNNPTNLGRLSADEHQVLHNEERWSTAQARVAHGEVIHQALERLKEDEEWYTVYSIAQRTRAAEFWSNPKYATQREALLEKGRNQSEETRLKRADALRRYYLSQNVREEHSERMKAAWAGNAHRRTAQAEVARNINLRTEITEFAVRQALKLTGSLRAAARQLGCDRSVFRRFTNVLSEFFGTPVATNHKVVAVRAVKGTHDVYCLTVPEYGNFALESGVFVKNCGAIVNVTPIEAGFEGQVVIEISNATPLPLKVHAGQGIAQFLFFQSDEPCAVSYADRAGKYQGQRGLQTALV